LRALQWWDIGFEGRIYMFENEKPVEPGTTQYHFKKILKEAGSKGKSFHTLRHTFAANCVENSTDVKALSELLGYSDARIPPNRYFHPAMDSKRKQIGALSDFYGQICGQAARKNAGITGKTKDFRRLSHSAKISTDFLSICPDMVIAVARFMSRSINSMGTI